MAVIWLFLAALFSNLWLYGTGFGPIAMDTLAQLFIRPYREWASQHGPLRRWFIALVAIAGVLWASFAAFKEQYAATQNATRDAQFAWKADAGDKRRARDLSNSINGKGGYKDKLAKLESEHHAPVTPITPTGRHLLINQRRALAHYLPSDLSLNPENSGIIIATIASDKESADYADEFYRAISLAGVTPGRDPDYHPNETNGGELFIEVKDPAHPPTIATGLIKALRSAHFEPRLRKASVPYSNYNNSVVLFVGPPAQ